MQDRIIRRENEKTIILVLLVALTILAVIVEVVIAVTHPMSFSHKTFFGTVLLTFLPMYVAILTFGLINRVHYPENAKKRHLGAEKTFLSNLFYGGLITIVSWAFCEDFSPLLLTAAFSLAIVSINVGAFYELWDSKPEENIGL